MSSRPRFGRDYIRRECERIADQIQTPVDAFLIGGGAMSLRNLKDTTKDIDLVATESEAYDRLLAALNGMGYEEITNLGDEYEQLGARQCVKNDDGCQIDLFNQQIADKLFFSDGMRDRSEAFLERDQLSIRLVALEDIFLFKSVALRPDDIDDMATLIQTGLEFEAIEQEIDAQCSLLGGERFTTYVSESLGKLDDRHGIQTPLDDVVDEYYARYMGGYELYLTLDEETPRSVSGLADELNLEESEVMSRFEYLDQYGFATRTEGGLLATGMDDRFQPG